MEENKGGKKSRKVWEQGGLPGVKLGLLLAGVVTLWFMVGLVWIDGPRTYPADQMILVWVLVAVFGTVLGILPAGLLGGVAGALIYWWLEDRPAASLLVASWRGAIVTVGLNLTLGLVYLSLFGGFSSETLRISLPSVIFALAGVWFAVRRQRLLMSIDRPSWVEIWGNRLVVLAMLGAVGLLAAALVWTLVGPDPLPVVVD